MFFARHITLSKAQQRVVVITAVAGVALEIGTQSIVFEEVAARDEALVFLIKYARDHVVHGVRTVTVPFVSDIALLVVYLRLGLGAVLFFLDEQQIVDGVGQFSPIQIVRSMKFFSKMELMKFPRSATLALGTQLSLS